MSKQDKRIEKVSVGDLVFVAGFPEAFEEIDGKRGGVLEDEGYPAEVASLTETEEEPFFEVKGSEYHYLFSDWRWTWRDLTAEDVQRQKEIEGTRETPTPIEGVPIELKRRKGRPRKPTVAADGSADPFLVETHGKNGPPPLPAVPPAAPLPMAVDWRTTSLVVMLLASAVERKHPGDSKLALALLRKLEDVL